MNKTEQNHLPCCLCNSTTTEILSLKSRDNLPLKTIICRNCGMVWSDPFPIDTLNYYSKDYRLEYKGTFEPKLKHIYRAARVATDRVNKIQKYLLKPKQSILDIGSGGGEFLYLLQLLGHSVHGIEPNEGYGNYAKCEYGLNVDVGFVQDRTFQYEQFDIITVWHVLEHLTNPLETLKSAHHWLKDDGILVVEVPNVMSVCQSPKSRFHTAHLYNFNENTLESIGQKAGFKVLEKSISSDGGNLFQIYCKSTLLDKDSFAIKDNYEKIKMVVDNHTSISHYISLYPYTRLWNKLARMVEERLYKSSFNSGKELLDFYFKSRDKGVF
jgi:SAM-dependent methyltransferase